ncbi:hypothetical protein KR018_007743 [Drosophila ironensis]|nr:hypothetical protein KR018_007743 [Drosophila ironensis]
MLPLSLSPLLLLLLLVACSRCVHAYDRSINYWEAFAPGKLLQRLDAITDTDVDADADADADAARMPQMKEMLAQVQAQEKLDEDVDEEAEADSQSAEGFSGEEDYERNYESFVKEYFDRAEGQDDEELGEETQAVAANVKGQRCRKTRRKDGQVCEVCRQPKNNEVSETCSYSHDDQPAKYTYGRGTQYRKYRDEPRKHKEPAETETETKEDEEEPVAPSSLCVRRQQGKSACYECQDSRGHKIERCYQVQGNKKKKLKLKKAKATTSAQGAPGAQKKRKPRSQQSQQSEQEQRIYKRTISYSYAQGMEGYPEAPGDAQTTPGNGTLPQDPPTLRRRRLVKIRRRRGPASIP